jgi:hypothetical protein
MLLTTLLVLVAHFVGDFVFQSDYMAKNKSKDSWVLTQHVSTYTVVLAIVCLPFNIALTTGQFLLFVVGNGCAHWITDYFTSRLSSYMWKEGRVHDFFVVIGFDQLIHYVCLMGLMCWMFGVYR